MFRFTELPCVKLTLILFFLAISFWTALWTSLWMYQQLTPLPIEKGTVSNTVNTQACSNPDFCNGIPTEPVKEEQPVRPVDNNMWTPYYISIKDRIDIVKKGQVSGQCSPDLKAHHVAKYNEIRETLNLALTRLWGEVADDMENFTGKPVQNFTAEDKAEYMKQNISMFREQTRLMTKHEIDLMNLNETIHNCDSENTQFVKEYESLTRIMQSAILNEVCAIPALTLEEEKLLRRDCYQSPFQYANPEHRILFRKYAKKVQTIYMCLSDLVEKYFVAADAKALKDRSIDLAINPVQPKLQEQPIPPHVEKVEKVVVKNTTGDKK